ncbi:hypothetical protein QCA50_018902 [Cerrena zonata]|uniref:Uncharacterized protein n=1 Tax=Cerrena zonata TaxID=2478898 RepID=A0AAW0FGR4_9APHY
MQAQEESRKRARLELAGLDNESIYVLHDLRTGTSTVINNDPSGVPPDTSHADDTEAGVWEDIESEVKDDTVWVHTLRDLADTKPLFVESEHGNNERMPK